MKPLNPFMAALLVASAASVALPRTSYADEAAAGSCLEKLKDETDARNAMTCLVASVPEAKKDVGARFAEFLQAKDSKGRSYLTDALRKDKKLLPAALAVASAVPEKSSATPEGVAILYFVIGPGDGPAPAWLSRSPLLEKVAKGKTTMKERLENYLAQKNMFGREWTGPDKIGQSATADMTTKFFEAAMRGAGTVFRDQRTAQELKLDIGANNTTGIAVPVGTLAGNRIAATSGSGYSFDDLYVTGAKVMSVYSPQDDGFRTISVKIVPTRDAQGNLINQIGITDITAGDSNSPSITKYVPLTTVGDVTVQPHTDGRKYTVNVDKDGSVTVKRGEGGGSLSTSITELTGLRNDQITQSGKVMVGDQVFYAVGVGGGKGSIALYSQEDIARDPKGLVHASLMADVAQVLGDGSTGPVSGKPPLGKLQNGDEYHLEFKNGAWVVAKGPGDPPPSAAKDKPGDKPGKTPGGTTPPAGGDQTTDPADTGDTVDTSTLDKAIEIAKAAGWEFPDALNGGFSDEARANVRIAAMKRADKLVHYVVLFAPGVGGPRGQYEFPLEVADGDKTQSLQKVRGFKNYVIQEYTNSKQYFTYKDLGQWVQGKANHPFLLSPAIGIQGVTEVDAAMDMLAHYFKLTPAELAKLNDPKDGLRARVDAQAKGEGYVLSGNATGKKIHISVGGGKLEMNIWPTVVASGDKGDNTGMTGLRGPGTAVSVVGGGPAVFKETMAMAGDRTATLVLKSKDGHIAMYTGKEDESLPDGNMKTSDIWYVMTDYLKGAYTGDAAKDKAAANLARTKPLPVFGGVDRINLPTGYVIHSLADVVLPDTAQLMLLHGSTQEKGAIAVYRTTLPDAQGGQNVQNKKANCGGGVIWWGGLTKAQVDKACEGDSKIP